MHRSFIRLNPLEATRRLYHAGTAGSGATGAPETLASVQRRHHTFRARLVIIPFMHHSEPYMSTNNTYG